MCALGETMRTGAVSCPAAMRNVSVVFETMGVIVGYALESMTYLP